MKKNPEKRYPTIAVCGLDCGLCPRYYTAGPSRCPGCAGPDFFNKHPSCSFITCCIGKNGFEVCSDCSDYPCTKFRTIEEYQQVKESSSYPSCKTTLSNLNYIKVNGIEKFIEQQNERIRLLKLMLKSFDDGRSKSFYCKSAGLLSLSQLEKSLDKAVNKIKAEKVEDTDLKSKAKIMRRCLNEVSQK